MRFKNVKHSSYFIIKKMTNFLLGNKISKLGLKIKICSAPLRNCSFYYYSISLFTELFCHFFVLYYLEWMSTLALKSLTASQFYFRCFFKNVCCDNWWHQIRLIHYVLFFTPHSILIFWNWSFKSPSEMFRFYFELNFR